jgi:hypothetical protein
LSNDDLTQAQLRAMFRDPLTRPLDTWFEWKGLLVGKRGARRAA